MKKLSGKVLSESGTGVLLEPAVPKPRDLNKTQVALPDVSFVVGDEKSRSVPGKEKTGAADPIDDQFESF